MAAGPRSRRTLWIVNGALVLLVLAAGVGTVVTLTAGSSGSDTGLRTVPVGRGTVTESVTAAGTVTSGLSSTVNFSTSGRIAEIRVRLGDRVEAGQVVARLDDEYAEANLHAAESQLDAARKQRSDAIDARDNPTTAAAAPAAAAPAAPAPAAPAAPAAPPAPVAPAPTPAAPTTTSTPGRGLLNLRGAGSSLVSQQPTPTPSPGGGAAAGGGGSAAGGSATTPDGAVASAKAQVAQAEATVVQARQATEDLDLESPQAGTVVSLDGVVGQVVNGSGIVTSSTTTGNPSGGALPNGSAVGGGSTGSAAGAAGAAGAGAGAAGGAGGAATGGSPVTAAPTAPAVLTVADLGSLQVRAEIPELDVARLAAGQAATIAVNALPGEELPGRVAAVDLLPGSGSAVEYGTAVRFATPPPGLRPGMSASVSVAVREARDTAFLPSVALTPVGGPGSSVATVDVLGPDGSRTPRTVGTGLASDSVTQVSTGIAVGELVVLPDPDTPDFREGGPPRSGGSGGSGG